uniref:Uncharacterized protein n=1 Tax=Anguilla anguilla TaxID=7936 RepID=A0A0E9Q7E0_ANGAN
MNSQSSTVLVFLSLSQPGPMQLLNLPVLSFQ